MAGSLRRGCNRRPPGQRTLNLMKRNKAGSRNKRIRLRLWAMKMPDVEAAPMESENKSRKLKGEDPKSEEP